MKLSVGKRLITLGSIVFAYAIFELVLGFEMNSVTLVADGFHNIADAGGFAIAVLVNRAQVGMQDEYRAERIGLIGGLINCSATLILCGCAGVEAWRRLFVAPHVYEHPHIGPMYFFCAVCGMCINFFGAMFLGGHGHSHGGVPCKSHESPPPASPTLPLKTTVKNYQLLDDGEHAPEADHGHSHSHAHSHATGDSSCCEHGHGGFQEQDRLLAGGCAHHAHGHGSEHAKSFDMNVYAIWLHTVQDALGSFIVLICGLIVVYSGLSNADKADAVGGLIVCALVWATSLPVWWQCVSGLCCAHR